ncbi:hypothetical protein [Blastococcus montanus]|uniref:hypothetical protein n=1 Tax=Blastococcus montanus TaxID=3144973 RepID=UPI0032083AE4
MTGGIPLLEAVTKGLTVRWVLRSDGPPSRTIPRLRELHRHGLRPFDPLITTYPLAESDRATADTGTGEVVEPVLLVQ